MVVVDGFVPVAAEKAHARIIWDCAWAHEGDVFVTAARDKTVSHVIYHMLYAKTHDRRGHSGQNLAYQWIVRQQMDSASDHQRPGSCDRGRASPRG